MDSHVPGLDHLRALAISLVFLFHYRLFAHPAWVDTAGSFGWTGVDLFFVLSGYLIAGQIFRDIRQGNFLLRRFFIKRFFRIIPAYWIVLLLYFIVPKFREWEHLAPAWKYLSFTQNLGLDLRSQRTFSHAWSLCIEEQFYLLLPLSVIALRSRANGKYSIYLITALFFLGFICRIGSWYAFIEPKMQTDELGWQWYKWIYYPTYNRLDGLLAGISIAGIFNFYQRTRQWIETHTNRLLVTGFALICIAYYVCRDVMTFNASVFGFPLVAIAFGFMVASGASGKGVINKYQSWLTSKIASLSFSVYLVHKASIHFTQEQFALRGIKPESSTMFILSTIITVIAALLLYYIVERPFLKLRRKLISGTFAPAATSL